MRERLPEVDFPSLPPIDEAISTDASAEQPSPDDYRVVVPVVSWEFDPGVAELGASFAAARDGTVLATDVHEVSRRAALSRRARDIPDDHCVVGDVCDRAETYGADSETYRVVAHDASKGVFTTARKFHGDLAVVRWDDVVGRLGDRVEAVTDDVIDRLPCDVLALKNRGFDPSSVLIATASNPDYDLSAAVGRHLRDTFGADVTLLHAADAIDTGTAFLQEWAADHGFPNAERSVVVGDPAEVVVEEAANHSMLCLGASERGVARRLVSGSVVSDVVPKVDCSVVVAENADTSRPVTRRLFGR